jgi:Flp pilus assembly pilin Flp
VSVWQQADALRVQGVACGERHAMLREKAQNVVEYGLLIVSIVVVVLLGVAKFGTVIGPWFASLAGRITTVGT